MPVLYDRKTSSRIQIKENVIQDTKGISNKYI